MAQLHDSEQRSYGHDLALITKHTAQSWRGIKHFYLWCTNEQGLAIPRTYAAVVLKNCGP